jgi:hypothetical protein
LETAANTLLDRVYDLADEADAKDAGGIATEIDKLLAGLDRLFARLNALQCELLKIDPVRRRRRGRLTQIMLKLCQSW